MSVQVVPIIYNHLTKQILRWYLLDYDGQLNDPAFKPQNKEEKILYISLASYKILVGMDRPLLYKLQDYVIGNAS